MGKKVLGKKGLQKEKYVNEDPCPLMDASLCNNDNKLHAEDKATGDDGIGLEASQSEAPMVVDADKVEKKKRKKKRHKSSVDVELGISQIASDITDSYAIKLKNVKSCEKDGGNIDSGVEQSKTKRKNNVDKDRKKKRKLEEDQNVIRVENPVHVEKHRKTKNRQMNGEEADEKKKKCKRGKGGDDSTEVSNAADLEAGKHEDRKEEKRMEYSDNSEKKAIKKADEKKKKCKRGKGGDDSTEVSNAADLEAGKHEDRKEEKRTEYSDNPEKKAVKKQNNSRSSKKHKKRVSFVDDVEVFPSNSGVVRGKRFSLEEDVIVRNAVLSYIDKYQLGEEGLNMVLNCRSHPEVRHCWKEIGLALPSRPYESVYYRAHNLFERDENRRWSPEELDLVRKFHEKHGNDWKKLASTIGKHRVQVKDAWRRIKLTEAKKGPWVQDEYQKLYDLVNLDLRVRATQDKKTKHGMLRDNISWEAISDTLGSRSHAHCCQKWYYSLTSPLVYEGKWSDLDDYHLMNALFALDAACVEDVDWDCLLEHRPGDVCLKRWNQLVKHLGPYANKSFAEQVEILSQRYCSDVLEAREAYDSKPAVDEVGR